MSRVATIGVALGVAVGLTSGCTLSRSVSKSVTTAVRSVSDSFALGPDSADARAALEREYRDDVRVATRELWANDAAAIELARELSRVAALHGINHWETESGTLSALGAGVCSAGASEPEVEALLQALGRSGDGDRALALQGCRTGA